MTDIINMALLGEENNGVYTWPTFKETAKTYTFGEIVPSRDNSKKDTAETEDATKAAAAEEEKEVNYLEPEFEKRIQPFTSRTATVDFQQSNDSVRFLKGENEDAALSEMQQYVEAGNFYHALLERIHTLDDIAHVIDEFEREGLIAGAAHKQEVEA